MLDVAIFLTLLGITSVIIYRLFGGIFRILTWLIVIGIAYLILKVFVFGGF